MNKDAMLAVADVIEHFDRFNLGSWVRNHTLGVWDQDDLEHDPSAPTAIWGGGCDTTGCIAGWAAAWAYDVVPDTLVDRFGYIDFFEIGRQEFDLNKAEASELFFPDSSLWNFCEGNPTAAQAADMLRLIVAGKIVLPKVKTLRHW